VVSKCPEVPDDILIPTLTWQNQSNFDATAKKLAGLFIAEFRKYESESSDEVKAAGPKI
jgi:phosphoenolpyruvate carboxykinase (ATP)